MVLGVCRRVLHNEQDAEDALQVTFLVLVRKAGSIRRTTSVRSWLYGVAYRVARKARLQSARQQACEQRSAEVARPGSTAEPTWKELQAVLDAEFRAFDLAARSITVIVRPDGDGDKVSEGKVPRQILSVASNAVIMIDGKGGTLADLRKGNRLSLILSSDANEVTSISAVQRKNARPEKGE